MIEQAPSPLDPNVIAEQKADAAAEAGKWEAFTQKDAIPLATMQTKQISPEAARDNGKTVSEAMHDFIEADKDLDTSIDRWVNRSQVPTGQEMSQDPRYAVNQQQPVANPDQSQSA